MSSRESRAVVRGSARRRRWSKNRPPDLSDLRIVLLGKSVSENSRVGNFLLGRAAFDSEAPPDVVERVGGRLKDRHVMVINSPQLLQTHISDHQITQTVRECVYLCDPGPHAFILVLQCEDFTEEDMRRAKQVLDEFSEEAIKRTIVLTTDEETHEAQGAPVKLNEFIQQLTAECGGGHLQLDNEKERLISGVSQRLEKILTENSGEFLTCDLYAEGSSGDEEQSRSDASLRTEDAESDGSVRATRQQKLNVVLCGSDETLKNTVSKLIREKKDVELHGHLISLVELPALFNTRLSEEEVMRQTLRCVSLCHPGVHAFLLIVPDATLTDEDKAEMEEIQRIFSSRINKHMMILIMQNSERQTAEPNEETQAVIERFGGPHHVFGPTTQVSTLKENIEQMLEENRGGFFSTETFLEAQMGKLMKYEEMKKKMNSLETHLLPQDSRENIDEVRIVLLGKTGVGKSATGNTILGIKVFTAETSQESVTKKSQRETSEINGRHVTVIDTPGLFDTELTNEEIQREISNCISMILPGPHVFIIVLNLGQRFTAEEATSVKIIQETFGERSLMFTMVLFTRGDDLKDKTIDQCLGKPGSALMKLIEACGNRFHVFNNNQTGDRTQVCDLLEKIDNMVKANGGSFYSCKMFREMEREKQEQQMKILMDRLRETEEEMRQERETFKNKTEQLKQEKEKVKTEKENLQIKYETETERLMNRLENERKKREEEFIEREERFITLMKEKEELMKKHEEEKERMKMMMEEERQNDDKERKRREEELKREITEQEKQQREIRDEMRRERETFKHQIEEVRREKEKIANEKEKLQVKYDTETDKLMNRIENERKRREEEFNEKEEREEKMREEMKREREEWEKQKLEEKMRREEEDKKRREKEQRVCDEFNQKLKEERERMEREKEDLQSKHEAEENKMKILMEEKLNREREELMEKLNREREELMEKHEEEKERMKMMMEKLNREREELMKKHEEEKERMKRMMEEERHNDDKERKRRQDELREREERYKREMKEQEEQMREIRDEMRRERETFKQDMEEMRREKETVKKEKENLQVRYDTEIDRLMKRIENEQQNHETERKRSVEELNEREERYKTLMKEKEEREEKMCEVMKREREEWEKQKLEEKMRREEEDKKRREKEQRVCDEFNQKLKEERERMEREKEDLQSKHEAEENKMKILMEEKLNREREELMEKHEEEKERMKMMMEKLNREREELMKKHEEEKERMKMMMEEERQNHSEERKRRDEEDNAFKHQLEEMRREKEKVKAEYETKRVQWETQKREEEKKKKEAETQKSELQKKQRSPGSDGTKIGGEEMLKQNPLKRKIPKNAEPVTPVSSLSSRRIVLLSKIGVGKSAAGNTILGQKEFRSEFSMDSITSVCSNAHATVSGRSVSVVDTPGLFNTQMKPEDLAEEIMRSVYLSNPGPHAFLIVFRVDDRFTEQEQQIPQQIEMMFGEGVLKYSIILFTHEDLLEGQSVEELIKENSKLRDLVDQCGGRFHVFNNRDENNREQVNDLLQKIDSMIEQNGGGHYSNLNES